jgi:hypothetical protein
MLTVFLLQLATGCLAVIALSHMQDMAWRYLRLMAVVSLALLLMAAVLVGAEGEWRSWRVAAAVVALLVAIGATLVWLVVNAAQGPRVSNRQRLWPAAAALGGGLAAIVFLLRDGGAMTTHPAYAHDISAAVLAAGSTLLGAGLLGSVTAGMLLGHRYLTETAMTIAPLRRMTALLAALVAARAVWVTAVLGSALLTEQWHAGVDVTWVWLLLSVRVAVGLVGLGVLTYMVWDCVRRRSTQSATGILYICMVFAFVGELAAQYLYRAAALAV